MIKLPKGLCLAVLVFLVVTGPTMVRAQTASEHFPDDDGGNVRVAGTMDLTIVAKGVQNVKTSAVGGVVFGPGGTPVPASGEVVAVAAINKLCEDAVTNRGLFCDGTIPAVCAGLACCGAVAAAGGQNYDCDTVPGAGFGIGFTITRPFFSTSFIVSPTPVAGARIQALNCRTSSGNTHGPDLLERVLVRVDPNAVHGNVVFRVHHIQGGQNPRNFTVNTTGLSDEALHNAIAAGYNNVNLGLTAVTHGPAECLSSYSRETFGGGNFVEVTYSSATQSTLVNFEVNGLRSATSGQVLTLETAAPRCIAPLPPAAKCPIDTLASMGDKATLTWAFPAGCALPPIFDMAKGDLDCLVHSCNPIHSCATCLVGENNGGDAMAVDSTIPALGQGFWYLARVDEGTWNTTGLTQCTDFDAALPLGCP